MQRLALGLTAALAFSLVSGPETAGQAQPAQRPMARPLEADRQLLRRAMVDTRVATDRPSPGFTLWARDAGLAFNQWLAGWMERAMPRFARQWAPFFEPAVMVLLALLAAALCLLLARLAFERRQRRAWATTLAPARHLDAADARTPCDWEGELGRRLASGDVAAAVEALWWWLASGLVADRAKPSWTSRELVARAGRLDLLAEVRRLDRMMYGAVRPSAGDVGRLWSDLREAVG